VSVFKEIYPFRQFHSWRDFHEVERMLSEAIRRGFVEEVPMQGTGRAPSEVWYRDKETGVVYTLIPPDPPAEGLWAPVDVEDFKQSATIQ
jgi:hypothetical protein